MTHPHWQTGQPCDCGFTSHLTPHIAKTTAADPLRTLPLHPWLASEVDNPRFKFRYKKSENDWGGVQRHDYDVEPRDAPATHEFTDEWGKTKRYGYDPDLVSHITNDRFGSQFHFNPNNPGGWQKAFHRDQDGHESGFAAETPADPNMLYRGLSHEEWEDAKQRGYFQSNGEYNIGGEQKGSTLFSTNPGQAESYAAGFAPWQRKPGFRTPSYVIGIPRPAEAYPNPGLGTEESGNTEIINPNPTPVDQVTQAWQFQPYEIQHGDMLLRSEDYGKNYFGRPSTNGGQYAYRPVPLGREVTSSDDLNPNIRKCDYCKGEGTVDAPQLVPDMPYLNMGTGAQGQGVWFDGARDICPECHGMGHTGLGRDHPPPLAQTDEHMNEWGGFSQDYNVDPKSLPPLGTPKQGRVAMAWPNELYHVSPAANRDAIQSQGLTGHDRATPMFNPTNLGRGIPGNYAFDNLRDAQMYARLHGKQQPMDIWRINGAGSLPVEQDPEGPEIRGQFDTDYNPEDLRPDDFERGWDPEEDPDHNPTWHWWGRPGATEDDNADDNAEITFGVNPVAWRIPAHVPPDQLQHHETVTPEQVAALPWQEHWMGDYVPGDEDAARTLAPDPYHRVYWDSPEQYQQAVNNFVNHHAQPRVASSPLYKRWVFSPASGQVTITDNTGDPLDVKYHTDTARELNEPNLVHGYAYRIGGGWRLTDWDASPVEDPFVIAQVMRALQGSDAPESPQDDSWTPEDEDWGRVHHGLPS